MNLRFLLIPVHVHRFVPDAPSRAPVQRRRNRNALARDPALWVWIVVAALALLPLGVALV
jgi:hypothetical protein